MAKITMEDLNKVNEVLVSLLDWSGIDDASTPYDTEIFSLDGGRVITFGDVCDALSVIIALQDKVK